MTPVLSRLRTAGYGQARRPACVRRSSRAARCHATPPAPPRRRDALAASLAALLLAPAGRAAARSVSNDWSPPGQAPATRQPLLSDAPPVYQRTPSGVVYELISPGTGPAAGPGSRVSFEYTLRRANGYFVYSTASCGVGCGDGTPESATLGLKDGPLIAGLDELLQGMRAGEKRRALVPGRLGYVSEGLAPQPPEFGQRRQVLVHNAEGLIWEVRLVKIRQ